MPAMISKPDNISTYLYREASLAGTNIYPNKNLDLLRAFHLVLGDDIKILINLQFAKQA